MKFRWFRGQRREKQPAPAVRFLVQEVPDLRLGQIEGETTPVQHLLARGSLEWARGKGVAYWEHRLKTYF